MGSDKCDWRTFEEATGKLLERRYGKGNVTKPAFRATERKDNDPCQEGHAHQSPGSQKSKTSNPDFIVSVSTPDGRKVGVVDAKCYKNSFLTAGEIDKLLSDKKSHKADFCILVVYQKDRESFNPIPESIMKTIQDHGIWCWSFDGHSAVWNTMQKEPELNARQKESVKKALSLLDAGDTSCSLRLMNSVMLEVAAAGVPILAVGSLWSFFGLGQSKILTGLATGVLSGIGSGTLPGFAAASAGAAASKVSVIPSSAFGVPIVALSFLSCALAAGAIGWAIGQVAAAEERLKYAKSVMEFLKESSRSVDHFQNLVKELEEEHDTYAKFLADVKQMENDNEEVRLNAHLWLMLILREKIPSLLLRVKDVSEQISGKAKHLQQEKDAAKRREEGARGSQIDNGIACGVASGGATALTVGTIATACLFPPLLFFMIPATVGSVGAAVWTGVASARDGNTKVCENRNGEEIWTQINKLESIQKKCQELSDGIAKLLQDGGNFLSDQAAELMGQWKGRQSKL